MLRNLALSLGEGVLGWDGHCFLFDSVFATPKAKNTSPNMDLKVATESRPRHLPVAAKNLPRAPLMTSGLTWVQMHCGELRTINTSEMQKGICMYCSGIWALPCLSGLLFPSSLSINSYQIVRCTFHHQFLEHKLWYYGCKKLCTTWDV